MLVALDAFERGSRDAPGPLSERQLTLLGAELRSRAQAWVAERGSAEAPRRRLAVATYVVWTLSDIDDGFLWQDTQAASALLEWSCAFLRAAPPQPAEARWYSASLTLLERAGLPDVIQRHLAHAQARFPGQGQWLLVAATLEEQRAWTAAHSDDAAVVPPRFQASVSAAYQTAAARDQVRQEAEIRWGHFELAQERADAALAHFDRAGMPDADILRYWLLLFRGRALEQKGRIDEAAAAFRLASDIAPLAQSGALALAGALMSRHRPVEAAATVSRSLSSAEHGLDPWLLYGTPDARSWPADMAGLFEAISR